MSSALLACPLCSQPGFETLDSLRYGLISAATRQIICPVCHDILYGLDKFTIHLFSHSVQHQKASNSLQVPKQHHPTTPVNQQPNSLLICTQSDVIPATKLQSHIEENLTHVYNCIGITNNLKLINTETEESHKTDNYSCESLKSRHFQDSSNVDNVWKEKSINNENCENAYNSKSKDIFFHGDRCSENSVEKTVKKCFPSNSESVSRAEEDKNTNDKLTCNVSMENSHDVNIKHHNVSVQCSGPESNHPISTDKSSVAMPMEEVVKCDICGFTFDDSSILTIHNQLVHSTVNRKDTVKNRIQSAKGGKQESISDEKRQFQCHLCSKAFKMRGSLMVHLRVAHSSIIGTGKSLLGKMDPENHSEERKFGCNLCSKSFRKEQHLTQHLKTHEGKQWECDVCSKMFTTKYFLKKHKRLHTGETPYSCDTCGKTFTFQQSYHKHLLYHSDDKPHVCTECDRAFKELSTLHNHQRIHTGEKPFACETCGKCFRQRVSYLVHRRIHTGAMPYQCTACGKSFRYKVSQRTHKCPSQPPGTVVRQSGELVQKLLQGAQQTSQVPSVQSRADSKYTGDCADRTQTSTLQISPGELKDFTSQFQQQHQKLNANQFTIVVGTGIDSIFPSSQILLAPDAVCGISTEEKNIITSITSTSNAERKNLPDLSDSKEKNSATMNDKINASSSVTSSLAELKKHDYKENITVIQNTNKNLNGGNFEQNSFRRTIKQNVIGFENAQEEMSGNKTDNKDLSQDSTFLHEITFHAPSAKSDVCIAPSTSEVFWKSSNKKQKSNDNSDLVVETADFFTMVMSPSGKSLPSPSERLKHLSLSSPVDTLLSYEDDGLYQFLLSSDNTGTSVSSEKTIENNVVHNQIDSIRTETNSKISHNDSEPLETINEESLKHLLYGSSCS